MEVMYRNTDQLTQSPSRYIPMLDAEEDRINIQERIGKLNLTKRRKIRFIYWYKRSNWDVIARSPYGRRSPANGGEIASLLFPLIAGLAMTMWSLLKVWFSNFISTWQKIKRYPSQNCWSDFYGILIHREFGMMPGVNGVLFGVSCSQSQEWTGNFL